MLTLTAIAPEPATDALALSAPRLRLTYQDRVRSRLAAVLPSGEAVAIMLPRGSVMRDGAVLTGAGGAQLIIEAMPEPLARVTAPSGLTLLRAVYHLANRHVPARICEDHVLIERDPVLERMLTRLGACVAHVEAPFDPESGAYGQGHAHRAADDEGADAASATIGEQLSIEAHRARSAG